MIASLQQVESEDELLEFKPKQEQQVQQAQPVMEFGQVPPIKQDQPDQNQSVQQESVQQQ